MLSPRRTTAGAIISCPCLTCGRTCSPRPVGARRERGQQFPRTSPGWRPDLRIASLRVRLPKDTRRIEPPTPYVWIDRRPRRMARRYAAVHKIQAGYIVTPLGLGKTPKPVEVKSIRASTRRPRQRSRSIRCRRQVLSLRGRAHERPAPHHRTSQSSRA